MGQSNENDELGLRERVRDGLRSGSLTSVRPRRSWGGPGTGNRCAVCGVRVAENEYEFELEFGDQEERKHTLHMHVRCCGAWEAERKMLEALANDR
jgi:hypothetical protein